MHDSEMKAVVSDSHGDDILADYSYPWERFTQVGAVEIDKAENNTRAAITKDRTTRLKKKKKKKKLKKTKRNGKSRIKRKRQKCQLADILQIKWTLHGFLFISFNHLPFRFHILKLDQHVAILTTLFASSIPIYYPKCPRLLFNGVLLFQTL